MKKLLFAVAVAATSLLPSPAMARGIRYDYVTTSSEGTRMYGRIVSRSGNIVTVAQKWMFDPQTPDETDYYHAIIDCGNMTQIYLGKWVPLEMDTTDDDYYQFSCKGGSSSKKDLKPFF